VVLGRCECGRATAHIHYSKDHDYFVKFGLVWFLVVEAVSFAKGWVIGSTTLPFSSYDIEAYKRVTSTIAQLTAPYQNLNVAATGAELLLIAFAFVALFTLHLEKWQGAHFVSIGAVIGLFFVRWIFATTYIHLTDIAIARLPEMVDAGTLARVAWIDHAFQVAYGFWGTPGPDFVIVILSLTGLVFFIGAMWKRNVVTAWTPRAVTAAVIPPPPPTTPVQDIPSPLSVGSPMIPPTKFCRYCGAKIPRDSKFCEDCGAKLT
jgi:hypothetical protein